jgi:hypothetical protein
MKIILYWFAVWIAFNVAVFAWLAWGRPYMRVLRDRRRQRKALRAAVRIPQVIA